MAALTPVCPWLPGRVLYHLHALAAAAVPAVNPNVRAAAPCDRGFRRLSRWVDHIARLGCGGVLLTPVFVSSTHGYDTVDPFRIDQRMGDEEDFAAFVAACHARDLKVILDGVFNHVGRDFGPFRDVLADGETSSWADWFRVDFGRGDSEGFAYRTFEGHRELAALNHNNPSVLAWACDVARHWLARGADGWRLDAAYAIPTSFVRSLTKAIREQRSDAFVFGEMIHGDYARFVSETGVDSVTQYELHKAIWSSLNDSNFHELAWSLKRHATLRRTFAAVTFVGNHDVTRLASQLRNREHLGAALAILLTVPGVPCLYYGDEFGWRGVKEHRAGGDDAIRPPLPLSAEPADHEQALALRLHQELIGLRRARPWLTNADVEVVDLASRKITYAVTGAAHALLTTLHIDLADIRPPAGSHVVIKGPDFAICETAQRATY